MVTLQAHNGLKVMNLIDLKFNGLKAQSLRGLAGWNIQLHVPTVHTNLKWKISLLAYNTAPTDFFSPENCSQMIFSWVCRVMNLCRIANIAFECFFFSKSIIFSKTPIVLWILKKSCVIKWMASYLQVGANNNCRLGHYAFKQHANICDWYVHSFEALHHFHNKLSIALMKKSWITSIDSYV